MAFNITLQIALELGAALFTMICALFAFISRKDSPISNRHIMYFLILGITMLLSDSCGYYFRGSQSLAGFVLNRLANYLVYTVYPLMVIAVARYLNMLIDHHGLKLDARWLKASQWLCYLHLLVVLASQFGNFLYYFDELNIYHRAAGYPIITVLGIFELVCLMFMVITNWKCLTRFELIALMSYIFLPFITNIFQLFYYGLSLTEITSSLCMILFFMFHEVEKSIRLQEQNRLIEIHTKLLQEKEEKLAEHEKTLEEHQTILTRRESALNLAYAVSNFYKTQLSAKEQQLAEAHVQISISQMQPHFIFNALGSIEQLCHTRPEMAAQATHQFAHYLRNNLIALSSCELKDFSEELAHIQAYVWLEKMRFGEDLNYEEDIQCEDFRVPVLSVQPLVENAIKHGMSSSEEGILNVTLISWEEEDAYKVEISDNGGGFDPDKLPTDSRVHVGLINVRERLRHMCNAELQVESEIGNGSRFTIVIPKDQPDMV